MQDGLLHPFVSEIVQDYKGNLWFATGGGLSQFNGVEFTNFTGKNGLLFPRLLSLAEDKKHQIWIGTAYGLNVWSDDSIYSEKNLRTQKIEAIEQSADGRMWISTPNELFKMGFVNGQFTSTSIKINYGKANDSQIFQDIKWNTFLIETANNLLFVGKNGRLTKVQNLESEFIELPENIELYSACETDQHQIIFGSNNGLYTFQNQNIIAVDIPKLKGFKVFKIKFKNDKLWMIGQWDKSDKEALFLVSISLKNQQYYKQISVKNGLIDNPTSLLIDHENNIWTGSNSGLSVLKGETFVSYTTANGMAGNKTWGVYQDPNHVIYAGTINQGFSTIDKDSIIAYVPDSKMPDAYISTFYKHRPNSFLIGTAHSGLVEASINPNDKKIRYQIVKVNPLFDKTRVDDIKASVNGSIWVASSVGLYRSIDGKTFVHFPLFDHDTGQVIVQKLLLSSAGKLFVGTKNYGLYEILNEIATPVLIQNQYLTPITSICEDVHGKIWIASQKKGILCISNKQVDWIDESKGLSSNLIYILQADKNGHIWIGTNLGLDKLNTIAYHSQNQIDIRHYNTNDGLQTIEMNLNGSIVDHEDNLWFATNNGLLKYDYRYDISNRIPPIVSILGVKIHSKPIARAQFSGEFVADDILPTKPVFEYWQNHITFDFIGVSFKNPKEIKYSWILDGFDEKWVQSSSNRQAIYSNLPPGQYVFKVKSSNNDGVWNEQWVEFAFEIKPPFWKTWWFIVLMVILAIGMLYFYIFLRLRSFRIRQKELQLIVNERTKEISLQKEELQTQRDAIFAQKKSIEAIHHHLQDSIDYAKLIQRSILPDEKILSKNFSDHFVFFKPKDKVSGDFYWWAAIENQTVITAADCTGHGVPGAFMSMLGVSFLREIVLKEYITHPGVILRKLRKEIIRSLRQKGITGEQKDGMDMALLTFNHDTNVMQFAGANNPIYLIRHAELFNSADFVNIPTKITWFSHIDKVLIELRPDKMPIAIYEKMDNFSMSEVKVLKGDVIYLFSDGYADQFGGLKDKKFMYKAFKDLLVHHCQLQGSEQKQLLYDTFVNWMSQNEQVDDVVVIGLTV